MLSSSHAWTSDPHSSIFFKIFHLPSPRIPSPSGVENHTLYSGLIFENFSIIREYYKSKDSGYIGKNVLALSMRSAFFHESSLTSSRMVIAALGSFLFPAASKLNE